MPSYPASSPTSVSIPVQSSLAGPVAAPVEVDTPSGQKIRVLGPAEEAFYVSQAASYQSENAFTNTSDLLDLDRLLFLELIAYRMSAWLAQGLDYDGVIIDRTREQRTLKETSELIGKVKADLGLTKSARDKAQQDSVSTYITTLKQRAREFGVHRETQVSKAISLAQQLFSIVGAFDRSDAQERVKLGFETEGEILDWVREVMVPEYNAVDEHFKNRPDGQRYWIRQI